MEHMDQRECAGSEVSTDAGKFGSEEPMSERGSSNLEESTPRGSPSKHLPRRERWSDVCDDSNLGGSTLEEELYWPEPDESPCSPISPSASPSKSARRANRRRRRREEARAQAALLEQQATEGLLLSSDEGGTEASKPNADKQVGKLMLPVGAVMGPYTANGLAGQGGLSPNFIPSPCRPASLMSAATPGGRATLQLPKAHLSNGHSPCRNTPSSSGAPGVFLPKSQNGLLGDASTRTPTAGGSNAANQGQQCSQTQAQGQAGQSPFVRGMQVLSTDSCVRTPTASVRLVYNNNNNNNNNGTSAWGTEATAPSPFGAALSPQPQTGACFFGGAPTSNNSCTNGNSNSTGTTASGSPCSSQSGGSHLVAGPISAVGAPYPPNPGHSGNTTTNNNSNRNDSNTNNCTMPQGAMSGGMSPYPQGGSSFNITVNGPPTNSPPMHAPSPMYSGAHNNSNNGTMGSLSPYPNSSSHSGPTATLHFPPAYGMNMAGGCSPMGTMMPVSPSMQMQMMQQQQQGCCSPFSMPPPPPPVAAPHSSCTSPCPTPTSPAAPSTSATGSPTSSPTTAADALRTILGGQPPIGMTSNEDIAATLLAAVPEVYED